MNINFTRGVKMRKRRLFIISIFLLILGCIFYIQAMNNESLEVLSRYGSSGEEVRQIQTRLKAWGYYNGSVDGIYGSKTQAAVRAFQKANGLTQDRNCRTSDTCCNRTANTEALVQKARLHQLILLI